MPRMRRIYAKERSDHWWQYIVKTQFDDKDWVENFRMSKATFYFLVE